MREMYGWYMWDRRAQGLVLGAVGTVALLLAALGIYGVMSLLVTHRIREIGVRIALGSTTGAILRLMVGAGLRLASVGMAIGLLLGLGATIALSAIFFGVQPFDYRVFVFAAGLLSSAVLFASWWPARRAMRVNPMVVLKSER
jgi:ABC-type antimicrobial peptide transport system permease subunit